MTLRLRRTAAVIGAIALAGALAIPTVAAAQATHSESADDPAIVVEDGVTQPAFGYADAIRERVWVDADFDSDRDGSNDVVAVDIIRPAATELGLKVPVIIDDSPYWRCTLASSWPGSPAVAKEYAQGSEVSPKELLARRARFRASLLGEAQRSFAEA